MSKIGLESALALVVDSGVRCALLLLAVIGVQRMLTSVTAAHRRTVWALAIAASIAIPAICVLVPGIPVLRSASPTPRKASSPALGAQSVTVTYGGPQTVASSAPTVQPTDNEQAFAEVWRVAGTCLMFIWLAGTTVMMATIIIGWVRVKSRLRRSVDAHPFDLEPMLPEYPHQANIRITVSADTDAPLTVGFLRPLIVLPMGAVNWSAERRLLAVRHELAHIRRADWLWLQIANLARAVYWFNPLIHHAARQLRVECERAADDCVLESGANPAEYASLLVEVIKTMKQRIPNPAAMAMAHQVNIESRLREILDPHRRRGSVSPSGLIGSVMVIAVLVSAVTLFRLTSSAAIASFRQDTTSCSSRLKQLGVALLMYTQDYDEMTPPLNKPEMATKVIFPYVKDHAVFACPDTGLGYIMNGKLAHLAMPRLITSPSDLIAFADAKPHGGTWRAAFLDGHVNDFNAAPNLSKAIMLKPAQKPRVVDSTTQMAALQFRIRELQAQKLKAEHELAALKATSRNIEPAGRIVGGIGAAGVGAAAESSAVQLSAEIIQFRVDNAGVLTERVISKPVILTKDNMTATVSTRGSDGGTGLAMLPKILDDGTIRVNVELKVTDSHDRVLQAATKTVTLPINEVRPILGISDTRNGTARGEASIGKVTLNQGAHTGYYVKLKVNRVSEAHRQPTR